MLLLSSCYIFPRATTQRRSGLILIFRAETQRRSGLDFLFSRRDAETQRFDLPFKRIFFSDTEPPLGGRGVKKSSRNDATTQRCDFLFNRLSLSTTKPPLGGWEQIDFWGSQITQMIFKNKFSQILVSLLHSWNSNLRNLFYIPSASSALQTSL